MTTWTRGKKQSTPSDLKDKTVMTSTRNKPFGGTDSRTNKTGMILRAQGRRSLPLF